MSFYIALKGCEGSDTERIMALIKHPRAASVTLTGEPSLLWADFDPRKYSPATDTRTGITAIISGRLSLPTQDWANAENLPYEGGLAARFILDEYISGGRDRIAPFNGACCIIINDPLAEKLIIWTDQFGYHPCFLYSKPGKAHTVLTSHPDSVLVDSRADPESDDLSMAEMIRGWRAVPPNTYYKYIKFVLPGTCTEVSTKTGNYESKEYWKPFETEFFSDIETAADQLASAAALSIGERISNNSRTVIFISGGADSRVLLFAEEDRSGIIGINLYERPSTEVGIARDLCASAGVSFKSLQRDPDYYPRMLPEIVRWSGAMWSAEDSHYLGFADDVFDWDPDLVMTACTTDWLFKGYGLDKAYIRLLGRNLPFFRLQKNRSDSFLPNTLLPAPAGLEGLLADRLAEWWSGIPAVLLNDRDTLLAEDRRIRPTSYAVSVSGQIMSRTFPYDSFLADSRIAECYSRIRPSWKVNREVWGKAAARICAEANGIVDSNYGWRTDAGLLAQLATFGLGWVKRRLPTRNRPSEAKRILDHRPPSSGSWPEFGWYATNSKSLGDLWRSTSAVDRDRLAFLAGYDPWSKSLRYYETNGLLFMRMCTLLQFWRYQRTLQSN